VARRGTRWSSPREIRSSRRYSAVVPATLRAKDGSALGSAHPLVVPRGPAQGAGGEESDERIAIDPEHKFAWNPRM